MAGLLLSGDLIFTSRVTGVAGQLGLAVRPCRSVDALLEQASQEPPGGVLLDLHHPGLDVAELLRRLEEVCPARPFVLGYGSHVEVATLKAAREAGCDLVLPRSKFVEELPERLGEWLAREKNP